MFFFQKIKSKCTSRCIVETQHDMVSSYSIIVSNIQKCKLSTEIHPDNGIYWIRNAPVEFCVHHLHLFYNFVDVIHALAANMNIIRMHRRAFRIAKRTSNYFTRVYIVCAFLLFVCCCILVLLFGCFFTTFSLSLSLHSTHSRSVVCIVKRLSLRENL